MSAWHFFVHFLGVDFTGWYGQWIWYNFWSGFGSDLGEFAFIGILWRKWNCHELGCWRIGHLPQNGSHYCRTHLYNNTSAGG